jgi:hypothetical protein
MGQVTHSCLRRRLLSVSVLAVVAASGRAEFPDVFEGSLDHPGIGYAQPARDPVAELNQKVQDGRVELRYDHTKPYFQRSDSCLSCHVSYATLGIPGMLLRSVYPDSNGAPQYQAGSFVTDHRLPVNQRWGGWYVTASKNPSHTWETAR